MRARIAGPSITHSSNKAWRTGGEEFGPAICGEPKMADFAATAGMELFHVGKFGIFRTRTPPSICLQRIYVDWTSGRSNTDQKKLDDPVLAKVYAFLYTFLYTL